MPLLVSKKREREQPIAVVVVSVSREYERNFKILYESATKVKRSTNVHHLLTLLILTAMYFDLKAENNRCD